MTSKFADIAPRIWAGVATDEELSSIALEDVYAIKSDGEHVRVRASTHVRRVDKAARSVEHVASDETPDRMGDIIRVKGWTLDSFQRNPQLLSEHNASGLPLGIVTEIRKGRMGGAPKLLTTSKLHDDEKLDESHRIRARLVLDGDMPAVSVGFQPGKTYRPKDEDERKALGVGPWGVVYETADLLELSVVTVPANPNALMRKLDALVQSGECSKALAAEVAREWTPVRRTLVPVAKVFDDLAAEEADETPAPEVELVTGGDVPDIASQLAEIKAQLDAIQSTFSGELAALKSALAPSAATSPSSPSRETPPEEPSASVSRGVDPQAFYGAAFACLIPTSAKGAQKK